MSALIARVPTMSVDDLHKMRANALNLLNDPRRGKDAELLLAAIDAELSQRFLPGMIARFKEVYPGGFYGERQAIEERDYKLNASRLCLELMAKETFAQLLAEKQWEELRLRASKVVDATNFIAPRFEKPKLFDQLKEEQAASLFFPALYALLWGEESFDSRFDGFCNTLEKLDVAKWTFASYFPFLAEPERCMFVKPTMLQKSLEISRYPLRYESTPSAGLYREILAFSAWLKDKLKELEPRDMIDVHSFMWHMAPTGKWADD